MPTSVCGGPSHGVYVTPVGYMGKYILYTFFFNAAVLVPSCEHHVLTTADMASKRHSYKIGKDSVLVVVN